MTSYITTIAGTGQGQYFADQSGAPILAKHDSVWGLLLNAGNDGGAQTWQSAMDTYCTTRAAQGFTSFLTVAAGTTQYGSINADGRSWDGVHPFTSPGVLNDTYFARLDYLLSAAEAAGLTVFLFPAPTYSYGTGGPLDGWTTGQWTAYGTAMGNRYKNRPNLVWMVGDDYFGYEDSFLDALKAGIDGTGDTHMWGIEYYAESTSRYDIDGTALNGGWGAAHAFFNYCYSYNASYDVVEFAYEEASPLLVMSGDGIYNEAGEDNLFRRSLMWWVLSSGARGTYYGQLSGWFPGSVAALTTSTFETARLGIMWAAFTALPGWHLLVPDTGSALVTAGRGTHVAHLVSGGGATGYSGGNTYVSASRTPDTGSGSSLAVLYLPGHTTITIDQTKMGAGYTATWVDPASGATSAATAGSTYNSTAKGTNSQGDPDWALVLQAPAAPSASVTVYQMRRFP